MKKCKWALCVALGIIAMSCIREEPLNAEADIESVTLSGDVLNRAPIIENDKVMLVVKFGTNVTELAPEFKLTPGATIQPPSGTVRDFSSPQKYVVTSQDGEWSKLYTVTVTYADFNNYRYDFEHVKIGTVNRSNYDIFYELDPAGKETLVWASGNPGFAMTGSDRKPDEFPTYQVDNGKSGKALALTTRRTGGFGSLMNKPIAAGNLFLGTFDFNSALTNALKATKFGTPFNRIPVYLKGYYKYTPGPVFYVLDKDAPDKMRPVEGKVDKFNIYAVFFEPTADMLYLDGENVLSEDNPNIIAVAEIADADRVKKTEWTEFNLPFVLRPGKEIDADKLADGRYSITIVFASSIDGDLFEGAPESTLWSDEVELGCP